MKHLKLTARKPAMALDGGTTTSISISAILAAIAGIITAILPFIQIKEGLTT